MIFLPSRLELYCSGYQPINDPSKQSVDWSKVPTSGSNAVKPNSNYVPPASNNAIEDTVSFTVQEFNNLVQLLVSQTERIAELEFKLAKSRASKVKVNKLRCSRK